MAMLVMSRCEQAPGGNGDIQPDRDLREDNRHMHEVLDVLGHELRSPLAAIRNALFVLEQKGDDAATREWARSLMERQTQCIGRMVDDLLDVSSIAHGKVQLRKQWVDLAQTVASAVETVRASVERRGHQVTVTLPADPVTLHADPARLEQMLTNLLNNAAKYTEPGGRIWVTAEAQSENVIFRVRDSGIGIEAEMLPRVFDSFWQVERSANGSQGGLGIGLALVRSLAELHGGSAHAYSDGLDLGSELVLSIPNTAMVLTNGR